MKVEDLKREKVYEPHVVNMTALMLTYERPGFLTNTLKSFRATSGGMELTVFDDGSTSSQKLDELKRVEAEGFKVVRLEHEGLERSWVKIFEWTIANKKQFSHVVMLEDDLTFASCWDNVLELMHDGVADLGFKPGAMTCCRCHGVPSSTVRDLNGVDAFATMWQNFQVNLVPMGLLARKDIAEQAVEEVKHNKLGQGFDFRWMGLLAHKLHVQHYCSMESWVAHEGVGNSLVALQGKNAFNLRGIDLVEDLRR